MYIRGANARELLSVVYTLYKRYKARVLVQGVRQVVYRRLGAKLSCDLRAVARMKVDIPTPEDRESDVSPDSTDHCRIDLPMGRSGRKIWV